MAFLRFARVGVEVGVIEVGLGGRLDSTNVIRPEVAVITNVGLEHSEHLGNTVAEIAAEKGGIVKPGTPLVTGARGDALETLDRLADELGVPVYALGREFQGESLEPGLLRFRGLGTSLLDAEQPSSTYCGSMKQLGALKRQKPRVQRSNSR